MANKILSKWFVLVAGILVVSSQPILSYAWEGDHRGRHNRDNHERPRFGMTIDLISRNYAPIVAGGTRYYYADSSYYIPQGNSYVLVPPPVGAIVSSISSIYRPVNINGILYYTDSNVFYVRTRYGYQVVYPPAFEVGYAPITQTRVVPEPQNQTKVVEGSVLGGIFGALAGGIIGHQMKGDNQVNGALLGGLAGAAAGGIMGAQIPNANVSVPMPVEQPYQVSVAATATAVVEQESNDNVFTVNVINGPNSYTPVVLKRSGTGFVGPQGEYYAEFPKYAQLEVMYSKK